MRLFKSRSQNLQTNGGLRGRDPQRRSPAVPVGQNKTFSYYASRSQADFNTGRETPQNKTPLRRLPTRLQRLWRHAGWLALAAVMVGLVVYELQLSTQPRIVSLASTSDAPFLQDSEVYRSAAHELFDASPGNRNKLTVNAEDIAGRLQARFPELQAVSVALPLFGDRPTIYIRPASPALVLAAVNGTFVIDADGRALAEATAGANLGSLDVPTVTDQSRLDVKLGEQVLPSTSTAFISTVVRQLAAQKIEVQSLTLPVAAGELNAYIANRPYYVRFNLQAAGQEAAELQAGTYIATAKKLEKQGTVPSQYVDVRLEGRAYYK